MAVGPSATRSSWIVTHGGIPHIEAGNDADAWFALGFCHGQDRSFQLELIARAGRGRLAELPGSRSAADPPAVADARVPPIVAGPGPDTDAYVLATITAYVAGINAARTSARRPHELVLLRAQPSAWTVEDVLAFDGLQSLALGGSWDSWTSGASRSSTPMAPKRWQPSSHPTPRGSRP